MQDAQAESGGLRAQLGAEQDMNRDLQERIRTLEADLIKEAERTFDAEEDVECLEAELADMTRKADSSSLELKVGTRCS